MSNTTSMIARVSKTYGKGSREGTTENAVYWAAPDGVTASAVLLDDPEALRSESRSADDGFLHVVRGFFRGARTAEVTWSWTGLEARRIVETLGRVRDVLDRARKTYGFGKLMRATRSHVTLDPISGEIQFSMLGGLDGAHTVHPGRDAALPRSEAGSAITVDVDRLMELLPRLTDICSPQGKRSLGARASKRPELTLKFAWSAGAPLVVTWARTAHVLAPYRG